MLFAFCEHIYMCAYVQKTHTWWRKLYFLREGKPLPYGVGEYQPIYNMMLKFGTPRMSSPTEKGQQNVVLRC